MLSICNAFVLETCISNTIFMNADAAGDHKIIQLDSDQQWPRESHHKLHQVYINQSNHISLINLGNHRRSCHFTSLFDKTSGSSCHLSFSYQITELILFLQAGTPATSPSSLE